MENPTGLELSLRRVALLGSEVLDRASRRRADWTPSSPTLRPLTPDQGHGQEPLERTHRSTPLDQTHLGQAFEAMAALMVQSSRQCMKVHGPDCCSELSGAERRHVSRFHQATGRTRAEGRPLHSPAAPRREGRPLHSPAAPRREGRPLHSPAAPRREGRPLHSPAAPRREGRPLHSPAAPRREGRPLHSPAAYSDFHIEVSPGSYTIAAGLPHGPQRAQRVSLHAGDSVTLHFDLSPLS